MTVESAADRAAFLADFGEAMSWTAGATTAALTVLAHTGTVRIEGGEGFDALNRRASIQCRAEDVPAGAAVGDEVSFRGAEHTVKSIEPDGTGMVLVLLEEVVED